ncbi:MAG: hypothetical protein J5973_10125 [Eubacterium sp.]|nr:hypothetical protein [Eubacterium sp.]
MRNNVITELNRQIQTARLQKLEINRMLAKHPFGNSVYMLELSAADGEMGEFYRMLTAEELELHPDLDSDQHSMMEMMFRANYANEIERFMKIFTPPSEEDYPPEYHDRFADDMKKYEKNLQKYSDYRKYIRFELKERRAGDNAGVMRSVQKTAGLDSGGEKENAKYVAILTGFMMLYQHEEGRQVTPGLIIMDEAFRKMGKKRIHDIVYYAKQMGLQSVLFAPNVLECMGELADTVNTLFAGENERTIVVFTGEAELNELYDRQEEDAS